MSFTSIEFHDLLDADIWVIEQMLTLPSDPQPTIIEKDNTIFVEITDTVSMPQMRDAVADYRSRVLPAIFVVSQKIYAELFRLVLDQCGSSAGNKQVDVERELATLVCTGQTFKFHPFPNATAFQNWWSGRYNYSTLRLARNQLVHGNYIFASGRLIIKDGVGKLLLDWRESDVLSFADEILRLSRKV